MKRKSFYVTCGSIHSHSLPEGKTWHKNNVLEISAPKESDAVSLVFLLYGLRWSNIYSEIPKDLLFYFPEGIVHRFDITPMEAFAIKLAESGGNIRPVELKNLWIEANGQRPYLASRDAFGQTAAAYKCLYRMVKKGILQMHMPHQWDIYFTAATVISSPVTHS